eukprot:1162086-Pelagomonas_calceolata.AAC.6
MLPAYAPHDWHLSLGYVVLPVVLEFARFQLKSTCLVSHSIQSCGGCSHLSLRLTSWVLHGFYFGNLKPKSLADQLLHPLENTRDTSKKEVQPNMDDDAEVLMS